MIHIPKEIMSLAEKMMVSIERLPGEGSRERKKEIVMAALKTFVDQINPEMNTWDIVNNTIGEYIDGLPVPNKK